MIVCKKDISYFVITIWCLQHCSAAIDHRRGSQNSLQANPKFILSGATVLEEPFIYGDNGKYRGFSVDIMTSIVSQLSGLNKNEIDFTVRQPRDGQLGNIEKVDGIYAELLRENADFAIGPISRNWFQNPGKASDFGLNFTTPMIVSKLSALLSRRSHENLLLDRFKQCQARMIRTYQHEDEQNFKKRPAELCKNNEPMTIEELFQNREIIKIVIQNSAVHQFLRSHDWNIKDQMHLIDAEDLFTAIDKVRDDFYVLIHETTLTHYQADKDCNLATIDQLPYVFYNELKNVILDSERNLPMALSWSASAENQDGETQEKYELKLFENELSLVIHKRAERRYELKFNRSLLRDINTAIDQLKQNGELDKLKRKHWAQFCRKNLYNSSNRQTHLSVALILFTALSVLFM